MQHYGLPTRLLDWSESPLVAAYFAVEDLNGHDEEGAIWGLDPVKFNLNQGVKYPILSPSHPLTNELFEAAFKYGPHINKILPIIGDHIDVRHLVQQSMFTLHGTPNSIEEMPGSDEYLVKIVIPPKTKFALLQMLHTFGITRASLFPDLQNLAKWLCEQGYDPVQMSKKS